MYSSVALQTFCSIHFPEQALEVFDKPFSFTWTLAQCVCRCTRTHTCTHTHTHTRTCTHTHAHVHTHTHTHTCTHTHTHTHQLNLVTLEDSNSLGFLGCPSFVTVLTKLGWGGMVVVQSLSCGWTKSTISLVVVTQDLCQYLIGNSHLCGRAALQMSLITGWRQDRESHRNLQDLRHLRLHSWNGQFE